MSKSTDAATLYRALRDGLLRSVLKKSRAHTEANSASCAISQSGNRYMGAKIESDTHLLDVGSEHVALLSAVQHLDFHIQEVVTLVDGDSASVSPLTLKVLADFGARTGRVPAYRVLNRSGRTVFHARNAAKEISFYRPSLRVFAVLPKTPKKNWHDLSASEMPKTILKTYASRGLGLAFPTYAGASSYGAAVVTTSKRIYFAGQYSAPDKRLGLHAELSAIIAALMAGEKGITHLGLVSDKFEGKPCTLCGCCRQFIAELSEKFGWKVAIHCFAKSTTAHRVYTIDSLLPYAWSSKKWQ